MTLSPKPDAVEVTQADRDAAGPFAACLSDMQDIFEGKADDLPVVQAFAHHRLASSTPDPVATTQAPDAVSDGEIYAARSFDSAGERRSCVQTIVARRKDQSDA